MLSFAPIVKYQTLQSWITMTPTASDIITQLFFSFHFLLLLMCYQLLLAAFGCA